MANCTECAAGYTLSTVFDTAIGSTSFRTSFYSATYQVCQPCSAGLYAPTAGSTFCTACPSGTWAPAGSASCSSCLTNACTSCQSTDGTCTSCTAGYTLNNGVCNECNAGTFAFAGATSCTPCGAGTWSPAGASSCQACVLSGSCVDCNPTDGSCSQCLNGLSPESGCTTCDYGYVLQGASCVSCASLWGPCSYCSIYQCNQCNDNAYSTGASCASCTDFGPLCQYCSSYGCYSEVTASVALIAGVSAGIAGAVLVFVVVTLCVCRRLGRTWAPPAPAVLVPDGQVEVIPMQELHSKMDFFRDPQEGGG